MTTRTLELDPHVARDRRVNRLHAWTAALAVLAAMTIWTLIWAGSPIAIAVMAVVVLAYLGLVFYTDAVRRAPIEATSSR